MSKALSKADQLRALREGRATDTSSREGGKARPIGQTAGTGDRLASHDSGPSSEGQYRAVTPAAHESRATNRGKSAGERVRKGAGVAPGPRETRRAKEGGAAEAQGTLNAKVAGSNPAPPARRSGRPRIEDKKKTLEATKPWEKAGMSKRTWFRRQAEQRDQSKERT